MLNASLHKFTNANHLQRTFLAKLLMKFFFHEQGIGGWLVRVEELIKH